MVHGDYHLLLPADAQVYAYTRTLGHQTLLVVANMSSVPATPDLGEHAALLEGEVLVTTHPVTNPGAPPVLAPWESRAVLSG